VWLRDAEGESAPTERQVVDPLLLLRIRAVEDHEHEADVVADDRVLVLQVVVETESLGGEVLADDRHAEVVAVAAAVFLGNCVAVVAGFVGESFRLVQKLLPLFPRQAAVRPVGARVLAAVVEDRMLSSWFSSGLMTFSMNASSSFR